MEVSLSTKQQTQQKMNKVDQLLQLLHENHSNKYYLSILCSEVIDNPDEWVKSEILRNICMEKGFDLSSNKMSKKDIFDNIIAPLYDFEYYQFVIFSHIGKAIRLYNLSLPEFNEIGIAKLRIIAPLRAHLSDERFLELLSMARKFPFKTLHKFITSVVKDKEKMEKNKDFESLMQELLEEEERLKERQAELEQEYQIKKPKKVREEINDEEIKQLMGEEEEIKEKAFTETETKTDKKIEPETNVEKETKTKPITSTTTATSTTTVVTTEEETDKVEYKYLNVAFKAEVYEEIIAEGLRIAEDITGYVDNERKLLYIFMDFIALHHQDSNRINLLKQEVEKLIS